MREFLNIEHTEHTESMLSTTTDDNKITGAIINSAIRVHDALGPGLLEKVYEECLCHLFIKDGFYVERQKDLPIEFDDIRMDVGFRLDLVVEKRIVVELKAVEKILPVHEAQVYTYLKLSKFPIGLLLNFNVKLLKEGIRRMVMTP